MDDRAGCARKDTGDRRPGQRPGRIDRRERHCGAAQTASQRAAASARERGSLLGCPRRQSVAHCQSRLTDCGRGAVPRVWVSVCAPLPARRLAAFATPANSE
eukprot:scaffold2352_cov103-Isochrysis_galbana.AAC.1